MIFRHRKTVLALAGLSVAACLMALISGGESWPRHCLDTNYGSLTTPWQCIGGCGAGGSGGGSNGIRWVGDDANRGKLKIEMLPKFNFGRDFAYLTAQPRLSFFPKYTTELGISMPIGTKEATVHHQSNMDPQTLRNGGRGDLTFDAMHRFGSEGQFSVQCGLTLPTGSWDEQRGPDLSKNILPQKLQMGRGVCSGTVGLYYSFDVENGMYLFDALIEYPFAVRFDKKNRYLDSDYAAYQNATENRERFYYRYIVKPYGESDRGDYYPPSASIDAIYVYRSPPGMLHSFQLFMSVPFGVRWIHSYVPTEYNPLPDPDHRSWDVVLSYGLEFTSLRYPLFLGTGLPVHDRKDPVGKWDAPDWEGIGNEWIFAIGVKSTLF